MTSAERTSQASRFRSAVGAPLGILALAATVGCAAYDRANVSTPLSASTAASSAGSPVVVSCEPNQRTLVRPVIVNGATLSQIECISNVVSPNAVQPVAMQVPMAAPVAAAPMFQPVSYTQPQLVQPAARLPDARVVMAPEPATVARPLPVRQAVYDDVRPVRRTRTVKKSAVIIGSSAGIGAGVGAAVGGKKGALLGAAIGGGGATLWDQLTRRDR